MLNHVHPMDCSLPGSSVHGVLQVRILEWVAMPSSRRSSWPRNWIHVSCGSCITRGFFTAEPLGKPIYRSLIYSKLFKLSIWCCWCLGGGLGGWQRMCAKWQGPYVFKSWTPSWVIGNHRKTFHTGTMRSRFWVLLIFCFNFRKFWFSFISFSLSLFVLLHIQ